MWWWWWWFFLPIIIPHQPSCFVLFCVVGWIVAILPTYRIRKKCTWRNIFKLAIFQRVTWLFVLCIYLFLMSEELGFTLIWLRHIKIQVTTSPCLLALLHSTSWCYNTWNNLKCHLCHLLMDLLYNLIWDEGKYKFCYAWESLSVLSSSCFEAFIKKL